MREQHEEMSLSGGSIGILTCLMKFLLSNKDIRWYLTNNKVLIPLKIVKESHKNLANLTRLYITNDKELLREQRELRIYLKYLKLFILDLRVFTLNWFVKISFFHSWRKNERLKAKYLQPKFLKSLSIILISHPLWWKNYRC